ncbi:MAG: hypothetical protein WBB74_08660, partial [Gaiellaceae bacterium]
MSQQLLEVARELEARDTQVGRELALVERLHARSAAVAARASDLAAFEVRLPAERERLDVTVRTAEAEAGEKARAYEGAKEELARAEPKGKREPIAAAKRAVVRTADAASSAAKELERLRAERRQLEARAAGLERTVLELEGEARSVNEAMRALPRLAETVVDPRSDLAGLVEW